MSMVESLKFSLRYLQNQVLHKVKHKLSKKNCPFECELSLITVYALKCTVSCGHIDAH